jgi:hypothetical protein
MLMARDERSVGVPRHLVAHRAHHPPIDGAQPAGADHHEVCRHRLRSSSKRIAAEPSIHFATVSRPAPRSLFAASSAWLCADATSSRSISFEKAVA